MTTLTTLFNLTDVSPVADCADADCSCFNDLINLKKGLRIEKQKRGNEKLKMTQDKLDRPAKRSYRSDKQMRIELTPPLPAQQRLLCQRDNPIRSYKS